MIDDMLQSGLVHKAIKGLPREYESLVKMCNQYRDSGGALLIVDDGLSQVQSYLPTIVEELTNREKATFIFVTQNTFLNSDTYRRMSEQMHYIIAMKNVRNGLKIRHLAMQVRPCNPQFIIQAYYDSIKLKATLDRPGYGYLVMDMLPYTSEITSVRSNIFPNEIEPICVYKEIKN